MIQNIDYAPTFLDAAGLDTPPDIQGVSILPLFSQRSQDNWRNSIYYHYYHDKAYNLPRFEGIRTERFKLIHYYLPRTEWELFDLKNDPNEIRSIYNHPEAVEIKKLLHKQLDAIREMYDIPAPEESDP
jgi:arylsulfatase A-like enzyme